MEYYLVIKNEEILPFATTWMDGEGIVLSEISQTEKDKYCIISVICGILKNKKQNKTKLKELTGKEIRLVVKRGREYGEGAEGDR